MGPKKNARADARVAPPAEGHTEPVPSPTVSVVRDVPPVAQVSDDEVQEETEVYSPSLLTGITPQKQEEGGEGEEEEESDDDEEATEVSVSPFDVADEMSLSNGFKSVIARNLQQIGRAHV